MLKIEKETISWALFAITAIIFMLVESTHFNYAISDENTYYLMGKEIAEGKLPYKDFFLAHPPLQVFLFAAIIKLFGFSFLVLKSTAAVATVVSAFFIFRLVKERAGGMQAIASSLLLFFSYDTLRYANFPTGVSLTAMFMSIGLYYYVKEKRLASGLMFGFAGITGLYSLVAAAALGLLLIKKRKELLRFSFGFMLVFLTVNLALLLIAGRDYITQTLLYHLRKPPSEISKLSLFARQLKVNWLLFLSPLLILLNKRIKKEVVAIAAIAAAYILFFTALSSMFGYYSMLLFPFLAAAGSYGITNLVEKYKAAGTAIVVLLFAFSISNSINNFVSNDFQDFKEAGEIADFVKENSEKNDELFGDDSTTPLIALLAGRGTALNFIDSNTMRFESGITDASKTVQELKESKLKYFFARKLNLTGGKLVYGTASMEEFAGLIKECTLAKEFKTEFGSVVKEFYVYDCKPKRQ